MPGFTSLQDIKDEVAKGHGAHIVPFQKGDTGNLGFGLWRNAGLPPAGTDPTQGLGGAVALDKTTVNSVGLLCGIQFNNAPDGQDNYIWKAFLTRAEAGAFTKFPQLILVYDRLAHANILISQATGDFDPVIDGTARLANGEGGMIVMEVTATLGAGTNTFNLSYTDEGENASTTPNITSEASIGTPGAPYKNQIFVPLANGDRGVRTITGWTLVSGEQTGAINIVIIKPILWLVHAFPSSMTERELGVQMQGLQKIHNNAHLSILSFRRYDTTTVVMGELRLIRK